MFRNLFLLFSTVLVGASTTASATTAAVDTSLDERLQNAQKTINLLVEDGQASPPALLQLAKWHDWHNNWHDWHNKWHNWNNWNDWHNKWHNWHNNWHNN